MLFAIRNNRNDDGNVETGGYGRDAEDIHGHPSRQRVSSSGGYSPEARQNLQSHGFEQRTSEYDRPQTQRRQDDESEGYGGGTRHADESETHGRGGRSAIGSGETYVGLNRTGDDHRRTSDAYGGESYSSNNQSNSYGSMNSNQGGGSGSTYVSGSGDKWKPGQTMVFQGAETETEKNPYAEDAQQYAGQTQGLAKDGVKQLENWVEVRLYPD